ncbi:ATP-binding domain-containing protein [Sinorhizobium meliloti]|uniref:ATP-binding domain-containing protein n=1 Tax=Rhizobium meliloti TaxID=382 RepID=UPI0002A599B4|nr:ATP-binding domain-containing protein [Sinorhizobium meliloti]AGA07320.1 hypothetical protein C770_GR4Chr2398 [Sinorhizobium meliloti GR4]
MKGNPGLASRIGNTNPAAVLARTNATTISAVIDALDEGKKPHLVGDKSELMDMLRGVQALKEEEPSTCPAFFGFKSWNEVVDFARTDEGAHLVTFVNLVEKRGEKQLMWALNRTVDQEKADLVISTGHKWKGREWKSVRLMDDFLRSSPGDNKGGGSDPAEMRLLYVALTRAKESLEVPEPILQFIERGILPEREKVEKASTHTLASARPATLSTPPRAQLHPADRRRLSRMLRRWRQSLSNLPARGSLAGCSEVRVTGSDRRGGQPPRVFPGEDGLVNQPDCSDIHAQITASSEYSKAFISYPRASTAGNGSATLVPRIRPSRRVTIPLQTSSSLCLRTAGRS